MSLAVSFRAGAESDVGFVMRSFVESWSGSEMAVETRRDVGLSRAGVMDAAHAMMTGMLDRGYGVTLAVDPVDPDVIYGYAVHRGSVLAWLYVRSSARRQGVAAALLQYLAFAPGRALTCVFVKMEALHRYRQRGWIIRLNPFLAMVTT